MDYNDKFLDLLSGDISEEDENKLIEELERNPELQSEFRLQKEVLNTICMGDDDTLKFRDQLRSIGNEFLNEKKKSNLRIRPGYWVAAASVITLFAISTFLGLFRNDPYSGDQLFMEYYQPYSVDNYIRGGMNLNNLDKAINLYQSGNTIAALDEFKRLTLENSELSGFFTALCQIELGNIEEASKELEIISTSSIFYADHINWYLSLCYLKLDQTSEAKSKLSEIVASGNVYSPKAVEILNKLD